MPSERSAPSWVNLPRPGNRTGYAPLHQAAWHGADFAVVSRLIAHGAWRTQRTRDGRRAVDVAREQGHAHLLEPVQVRRLLSPQDVLEHHFHTLLRERTGGCFEEYGEALYVHGHSRMDADDGDHYRVTPQGWSRIERRRTPPPPPPQHPAP
ncbi:hypothetical protein [Streptomyces sp. NPDC050287]|uniref:hypothetical protein n=1 Tax=Streptomyces sp. NPDC050287 TaxID=3365608 RepID=UPI00379C6552